jgi:hypothetical protein
VLIRRVVKLSTLAVALMLVGMLTLLSASVYTFQVLTEETKIAEIRFDELGLRHYRATLTNGQGCTRRELEVYGDQWRIDAQFLKWKYWALLLGLDAQYRLDRFEGRYRDVTEQNTEVTLAHDLAPENALDVVAAADFLGRLNFLVDATYGSSTYQDIDTRSIFRVYSTQTGLLTRSVPRPAGDRGAALVVEITRGCGAEPGAWERFARWTDSLLANTL